VTVAERLHKPVESVYSSIERIGPSQAEALIGANSKNRHVMRSKVEMWSRAMAAGNWILNGESIKVAGSGILLDGQHRLLAVLDSGSTIETVVVRGLPEPTQETVDIGDRRSLADILTLRGEQNTFLLAASLMVAVRLDMNGNLFSGTGYIWPSSQELLDYLDENPGIRDSVIYAGRVKHSVLRYPGSLMAGLYFHFSRLDIDDANAFWERLLDGVGLDIGQPVLTLRQLLLKDQTNQRRMSTTHRAAVTIKAWNAFRAGRSLQILRWSRGGATPEDFPAIQ
jgi:hypothetical protein